MASRPQNAAFGLRGGFDTRGSTAEAAGELHPTSGYTRWARDLVLEDSFGCVCEHAGNLPRAQFVHVQFYGVPAILQPSNPWCFMALQHQTPMSCVLEVASRLSQTPGTTRSFLFAEVWCRIKSCEICGA